MRSFRKLSLFPRVFIFCTVFAVAWGGSVLAEQGEGRQRSGQEASVSQAQATLASLFGRGATMPVAPRVDGAIALPSFDSSGMKIDEETAGKKEA